MPAEAKSAKMEDLLFKKESKFHDWYDKTFGSVEKKAVAALSSPEAKVEHVLGLSGLDKLDVTYEDNLKNLDKSLALKEEGNVHYKEGRYKEARDAYTKSLQLYPVNWLDPLNNSEYSIILANRSAALDAGRSYAGCVQDIEQAFKYGYPKNLQFKIYHRKGHALLKLKQFLVAKEAFTRCLDMIGKSDMTAPMRDKFRAKTKKQMTVFNVVKRLYNQPVDDIPDVKLAEGPSELWKEVSAKVELKDGKNLIAAKSIAIGDGLLREEPLVAVILEGDAEGKMCPHTLARMAAPVPCTFGGDVLFCSEEVRRTAEESYHRYEWRFLQSLKDLGLTSTGRLALRMVTSLSPDEVKEVGKDKEGDDRIERFKAAFRLADPTKVTETEGLCAAVMAAFFLRLLRHEGYSNNTEGRLNMEEKQLASLLFKAVLVATQYSTPITMPNPPQEREALYKMETFPVSEFALGIFPAMSKFSACAKRDDEPDLFLVFKSNRLILQANRVVEAGQAVSLNLKPDGSHGQAAVNDMITFRCSNQACKVGFPLKENTKEKLIKCPMAECGKDTNIWLKLKRIQELKQLYLKAKAALFKDGGELKDYIKAMKHLISEWEMIIIRPYKDITQLEKDLRFSMLLQHVQEEHDWMKEHL